MIYKIILLIFSSLWTFSCSSKLGYEAKSKNLNKTKTAENTSLDINGNELTADSSRAKRSPKGTANSESLTGSSAGSSGSDASSGSGVSADAGGAGADGNASASTSTGSGVSAGSSVGTGGAAGSPGTDSQGSGGTNSAGSTVSEGTSGAGTAGGSGDSTSSEASSGSGGAAGSPGTVPAGSQGATPHVQGKPFKTALNNINSESQLLDEKVLKYLNAIITGNDGGDGRKSLIPSGGFINSVTTERKYGITPDCTPVNEGNVTCKIANESNKTDSSNSTNSSNTNKYNHGYYFEVTKGSQNNIYTYTYEGYRATTTDFYITGEIQATVHTNNVELKGQVRIHPTFYDAVNSANDVIIVKFGEGNVENDNDSGTVMLDANNVPESGKLTISLDKGGDNSNNLIEKTYDLHVTNRSSRLSDDDKRVINSLGLFKIN